MFLESFLQLLELKCMAVEEKQLYLSGGSRLKIEPCVNMLEVMIKCPVLLKNTGRYSMIYRIFYISVNFAFNLAQTCCVRKCKGWQATHLYRREWVRGSNSDTKVNTRKHEVSLVEHAYGASWLTCTRPPWNHGEITSSFSQVFFKFPTCFGKPSVSVFSRAMVF